MLVYQLSNDINQITMHWKITEIIVRKNENVFFSCTLFKFETCDRDEGKFLFRLGKYE